MPDAPEPATVVHEWQVTGYPDGPSGDLYTYTWPSEDVARTFVAKYTDGWTDVALRHRTITYSPWTEPSAPTDPDRQCMLWYMRYHSPGYEMCDDERQAVNLAFGMTEMETANPIGVQYSDGRFVDRDDWAALRDFEAEEECRFSERQAVEQAKPPRIPLALIPVPWEVESAGGQPMPPLQVKVYDAEEAAWFARVEARRG